MDLIIKSQGILHNGVE